MALRLFSLRLLLGLMVACMASAVQAAECGPYRVAYYEFGSLYYRNAAGEFHGIDKDIMDELGRRTGCRFESYLDSRVRIWTFLADGSLDMTVSGIQNAERDQIADFAIYLKSRNYLLLVSDRSKRVNTLQNFTDDPSLRLAVVKFFKHGEPFDSWIEQLKKLKRVDEYADADMVARIVAKGRADGFLSQPLIWARLIEKNLLYDRVRYLDVAPNTEIRAGLVMSRKRMAPEHVRLMQDGIKSMLKDGTMLRIYQRHLGADLARRAMP